jgi:hypothetical protein
LVFAGISYRTCHKGYERAHTRIRPKANI